jgi:hypothetical protein
MARWLLREAHYLYGRPPDLDVVEWEHKETDRLTGRENRKRFKVPFYFDVDVIVCHEGKGQRGDSIFEGPPTPGMDPLDDEAEAISATHRAAWQHPIETLPGNFNVEALMQSWGKEMAEIAAKMPKASTAVAESGVTRAEFDALQEQLKALMARNAELEGPLDEPELPMPPKAPPPKRSELRR